MTTLPLSRAATLPSRYYLDPALLEREKERVFGATWQLVARAEDMQRVGDFVPVSVLDEPLPEPRPRIPGRVVLPRMTYQELLALARRCAGETLETVTGREFRVGVYLDCPFFTPVSSGRGQSDGRKAAERFLARYNEIGSLRPGDYAAVTRNASYFIGLLRRQAT